ncbi:hypothetical protein LPUS_12262 [Lasallia pustulata]|uniref:Retrovirus-related Pol polyprotein from transposon TNT 1-94-like beta-barrel domain-containing protein n=1 Tax=Lasallia pustulata TaxID=136370 RepID=A0A1W5DEA1_9LECA|nr:hypothetical protein LPUS_12262 [Lasallia pustulata]
MASADERDERVLTRRISLTGFDNWARWSSNTKASMQEKGVWDLTGNGAATQRTAAAMEKAKGTALRIILETVDDNLFRTIDGIEEIAEIWNKLKTTCSQVGQGVVYAILNELFGYASANKSKGYTKSVNTIFGDVGSLIKRLKSAVREDRDIWDDIHIIVALGALSPEYDNNKAHITTSKELQCKKFSNTWPLRKYKSTLTARPFVHKHPKHRLNKVANVSTDDDDESEEEGKKLPLRMAKQKLPAEDNCWYVDTCAAQHITNHLDLFEPASFYDEEHEFEAANSEALYCTKKGTIAIPTGPGLNVQIRDVCYVPKASANLISMGILKRCGWSYSDEDDHMLLTKETVAIRAKLTKQNIYRLVVYGGKEVIMAVQGQQGRPTHLMGATPTQHLWHRRFGHASHEKIKLASTMVNGLLLHHAAELYETANQSASDSECLTSDSEHLMNGSEQLSLDVEPELLATLQADKDPPNVCIPCVQSKQTRII